MVKKVLTAALVGLLLTSTGFATTANAATVKNGASCSTFGKSITVKVKNVSKAYVCGTNPTLPTPNQGWVLKTCKSYYASYKNSQTSIDEQRSLINSMSEPDKTTYTKQLDATQKALDKVLAAINTNHCKTGL
jgi:hypothetical protein